jgi:hypothetical protein
MNPETESFNCYKCEDIYHTDEAHHLEEGDYCFDCYADTFIVCDYCKEAIKKEKIYTIKGEEYCKEEEGDYCFVCAFDTLQSKLSSSFQGVDIEKVFIFYRKFIKEAQEAKEKESKMFHARWFEVRVGETILKDENGKCIFETYAETKALFDRLIEGEECFIVDIIEIPTLDKDDWKARFKHHEYPAEKIVKTWNGIELKIGKEQYEAWMKLKGTPEYDTYCGMPGCMNYLLQIPFAKNIVEE